MGWGPLLTGGFLSGAVSAKYPFSGGRKTSDHLPRQCGARGMNRASCNGRFLKRFGKWKVPWNLTWISRSILPPAKCDIAFGVDICCCPAFDWISISLAPQRISCGYTHRTPGVYRQFRRELISIKTNSPAGGRGIRYEEVPKGENGMFIPRPAMRRSLPRRCGP